VENSVTKFTPSSFVDEDQDVTDSLEVTIMNSIYAVLAPEACAKYLNIK
jgi:hypothetical protein